MDGPRVPEVLPLTQHWGLIPEPWGLLLCENLEQRIERRQLLGNLLTQLPSTRRIELLGSDQVFDRPALVERQRAVFRASLVGPEHSKETGQRTDHRVRNRAIRGWSFRGEIVEPGA